MNGANNSDINLEVVQDYWDRQPCNLKHSQSQIGTAKYYDEVTARRFFVEPHILDFANFESWSGKSVLEIGCGIGTDAAKFAEAGANYTGIELSQESISIAEKRFEIFNLNGTFSVSPVEEVAKLGFKKGQFDLVYSFGVIHHTPNPGKALQEIHKICDSNTEIRIMLYAKNSWKSAMIENGLDQPEAQTGCPIAYTYTKDEVIELFESSGFLVTDIKQDHVFQYHLDKYKNYQYEKLPWFDVMPEEVLQAIKSQLGWHLLIKAKIL